jgi:phosphotransferase system HPr (HPr) family protein
MTRRQATVRNAYGIHCRPSAVIVTEAKAYTGTIQVRNARGDTADVKSIMSLLQMGITCGQTLTIAVSGPDEARTCERMVELFETNFDFQR